MLGILPQRGEHSVAVEFRHHHIAQDQIGFLAFHGIEADPTVLSPDGLELFKFENREQIAPHFGFVFDDEDFFHNGRVERRFVLRVERYVLLSVGS